MIRKIFGISSYDFINICGLLLVIIYISIFLKVKPKRYAFYTGAFLSVLFVVGARLLYVFDDLENNFNLETIFMLKFGGMDLGGAFIAFPLGLFISHKLFKIEYKELFNVTIEALILESAIAKFACFRAGCCGGIQADVPWAINGRHPAQLYEVAIWIIVYIEALLTKGEMNNINRVCLITIGCILMRMPVETFRADAKFFIEGGYWVTYKILLGICTLILVINNRSKIKEMFIGEKKNDKQNK